MFIQSISAGPCETNAYIIACEKSRKALLIDLPPDSAEIIISVLEQNNWIPEKILLTHSHWDHIGDVAALKEKYHIPVFIHAKDSGNLENPGSDGLPLWMPIRGVKPDGFIKEADVVTVGDLSFQVIETPGHTPGGICLYGEGILISGDTLFAGSIGNLSFPTAEPDKMWTSLDRLAALPPQTKVYPGHGPATSIGSETWLPDAKRYFN